MPFSSLAVPLKRVCRFTMGTLQSALGSGRGLHQQRALSSLTIQRMTPENLHVPFGCIFGPNCLTLASAG